MLELTVAKIRRWGQRIGVDILRYAELDYWLTEWLAAISRDDWLAERLDFKGGTALNKVYLGDQGRLSVDLDFNSRGDKDDVQESRPAVLERLEGLAHGLDSGAEISRKNDAWEMFGLAASFQPITGGPPLKVKVEISTIDRFSVFPRREETLETPESGRVAVATLRPDELVATKLHAVYARRKGRDVFDLERAVPLLQDRMSVRRMAAL